jgi:ring-1,2-phenylacetyl-CoA epoxidase subunit PaaD
MVTREAVIKALHEINDPEMPINIVDLGIVDDVRIEAATCSVNIDLLPTFVGCPALHLIEEQVRSRVGALPGVGTVAVQFRYDPPWTVNRISRDGRETLEKFGVTVPSPNGSEAEKPAPQCPFCGSSATYRESPFGPTRCRMIFYCTGCRSSFEHLKRVNLR